MLVLIFTLIFSVISVSAVNSNIYVQCSQLCFASMTPYESNVNSLFTTLPDSASLYNFNKFEISQSDVVYGLYQCRGDLNSSDCRECVGNSVSQLQSTCPLSIGGNIQLDGCFVKYDNRLFFGVDDKIEVLKKCGPLVGSDSDVLKSIDDVLKYLVSRNGEYFRKKDSSTIEGVAQCVQDLSASDCQDCISEASQRLRSECDNSISGEMYLGKCYIKYGDNGKEKNNCNNCCNGNDSDDWKTIMIQVVGAAIGTIVSAVVSAVVSAIVSYFTSKSYIEPVRGDVKQVQKTAKKAQEDVTAVRETANKAQEDITAVRETAKKTHDKVKYIETKTDNFIETMSQRSNVNRNVNDAESMRTYHMPFFG